MLFHALFFLLFLNAAISKRDTLTHIIVPYHYKQLPRLLENIATWSIYPPFLVDNKDVDITFVFYSSGGCFKREIQQTMEEQIEKALPISLKLQHVHAYLDQEELESYLLGSRAMFDKLLFYYSYKLFGQNPVIFFYMEPDCRPIRPGWALALSDDANTRAGRFWMQGSLFRGNEQILSSKTQMSYPLFLHINGNAMYNVGMHSRFREFYLLFVETMEYRQRLISYWMAASNMTISELRRNASALDIKIQIKPPFKAFDMSIAYSLYLPSNLISTRAILDKFLFTDVVQNYWKSDYCLLELQKKNPNTFLVHGGQAVSCGGR